MESGTHGHGKYQLEDDEILSAIGASWGVAVYQSIGTTMDVAKGFLSSSEKESVLVVAKAQSAGRGRQGRSWLSPEGGFYATFGFRSPKDISELSGLSLVSALAVLQALNLSKEQAGLKWPNDLMSLRGEKFGGVLIETSIRGDCTHILIGTGINLIDSKLIGIESTCLQKLIGKELSPLEVACRVAPALKGAFENLERDGFAPYRDEWLSRALYLGKTFEVQCGPDVEVGIFQGVNEEGALILETKSGSQEIVSGHVIAVT